MSKREFKTAWLRPAVWVLALCAVPGWAQWQWTDASGRTVFSDTAPPSSVPEKSIQRKPGNTRNATAVATPPSPAPGGKATPPPASNPAVDKSVAELEAKKKQAEDAEKAKQKAEELKAAQAKADNCQRARRNLGLLGTGQILSTVNAKGERVFMDEATRNAENARLQQIVQQSCRP